MFQKRINSFKYAFNGINLLIKTQIHARIHVSAIIIVSILGWYLRINTTEWLILILCFGSVLSAEGMNSAIETLTDLVSPEYHPLAGKAKDLAAGAVLILALMSMIVGGIIFIPKISGLCLTCK
jgi:diacylglycerol kinase (ATP)